MSGGLSPGLGDLPEGSQVASYQIRELIGRGGMAVVYRAVDVRLDRQVALKLLAPELARNEAFRLRFIRESRAGAAVDHPNVIPVFEAGEAEGLLFIAMRYVSGRDVRALIEREGRLPPERALSIVSQVASALDAAHAHGLVHRDVKPANMLIATIATGSMPDHVYLSDFGLSKQSLSSSSLTGTGQFLGTIDYMAPEQIEGRPVDGRTDLYALACAAFEMLSGEPPFRREEDMAVMWAQVSAPPPSLAQRRPDLPAAVDPVIAAAMAKTPSDRPGSCLAFADALRAACGVQSRVPEAGPPPEHPATELAHGMPAVPPGPGGAGWDPGQQLTMTDLAGSGQLNAGGTGRRNEPGPSGPGLSEPPASGYPGSGQPAGWPPDAPPGYQGFGAAPTGYPGAAGFQQPPGQGLAGTGPMPTGPPGWQPDRQRRQNKGLMIVAGCVAVLVLVVAALVVLHLRAVGGSSQPTTSPSSSASVAPTSPGTSSTPTPSSAPPSTPAAVVQAYINAINRRDYQTAWQLDQFSHGSESFSQFRNGFATTQHDSLSIISTAGNVVTARLTAVQTDGTTKIFEGTYTVQNGTIVDSSVRQLS